MANVNGRPGSWEVILLSHSQLSCGGNRGWHAETTQTPSLTWFGQNARSTEKHTIWHVARINVGYNARPHSLSFFGSDSYPCSICCTLTLTPCKSICVHQRRGKSKQQTRCYSKANINVVGVVEKLLRSANNRPPPPNERIIHRCSECLTLWTKVLPSDETWQHLQLRFAHPLVGVPTPPHRDVVQESSSCAMGLQLPHPARIFFPRV